MNVDELRKQIDGLDAQISELIAKRIDLVKEIGKIKRENGEAVSVPSREKEILSSVTANLDEDKKDFVTKLYQKIFELSKACEQR